jgi:hypothetical protein
VRVCRPFLREGGAGTGRKDALDEMCVFTSVRPTCVADCAPRTIHSDAPSICNGPAGRACFFWPIFFAFAPASVGKCEARKSMTEMNPAQAISGGRRGRGRPRPPYRRRSDALALAHGSTRLPNALIERDWLSIALEHDLM